MRCHSDLFSQHYPFIQEREIGDWLLQEQKVFNFTDR